MKLLVTGAWQSAAKHLDALRAMGHEVVFQQQEREALVCDPAGIEGVICNGLFLHHALSDFSSLKYLQLTSAGYDRVPMDEVRARGIEIRNARGVYSVPMAEHALWGVLTICREGAAFLRAQQNGLWEKRRGLLELAGKTVCILGCGSVGTACAERFRAMGCRVLGVNRTVRANPDFDVVLPMEKLDAALGQADVVILTLPLTDATRGLMNDERFAAMKDGAVFVNIARGALVDDSALLKALRTKLRGAVLDVFASEPLPPESPFWTCENVLLTPHNSFVGDGSEGRLEKLIFENLRAYGG